MDNGHLISEQRISLPRIGNFMCDNCGHRVYGSTIVGSYNSFNDYDNDIRHRSRLPRIQFEKVREPLIELKLVELSNSVELLYCAEASLVFLCHISLVLFCFLNLSLHMCEKKIPIFQRYLWQLLRRPHSVYADDSNYVRFSFRVSWQQNCINIFSSKLGEPYFYVTLEFPRSWSLNVILQHIIKIIIINQIQHYWQETSKLRPCLDSVNLIIP